MTGPTLDVSDDFALLTDGLETMQFTLRGSGTTTPVPNCLQRPLTNREVVRSNGAYTADDFEIIVPANEGLLPGLRLGDLITLANGDVGTIIEARRRVLGTLRGFICKKVKLDGTMLVEAYLLRLSGEKDEAGYTKNVWAAITSFTVRVHPELTTPERARARAQLNARTMIYLPTDVEIQPNDRVRVAGEMYRIIEKTDQETLDRLPALTCEWVPA